MRTAALILFCLWAHSLFAQAFQFKTYTTHDGLSSNAVSVAIKDDKGFLWLATSNGLNRFDGNAFDHFYNNPADSTSIASNEINNLFIDSKKNLWITTMAGLSLYHPHSQTFSNYAPDTFVLPRIGHLYPAIAEDDADNIWLGGWYDLLLFNKQAKKFTSSGWAKFASTIKPADGNHSRVVVLGIKPKGREEFWVLTTYGLFSVNKKTLQFKYYPFDTIKDYYGCQLNYVDDKGVLWMGTYQNGIVSYDPSEDQWRSYATPVTNRLKKDWDWAYGITGYHADSLVYSTQKGLLFLIKEAGSFTSKEAVAFPKGAYFQMIRDGNYWWLVSMEGLTKVYPASKNFSLVKPLGIKRVGKIYPLKQPYHFILTDDVTLHVYVYDQLLDKLTAIKTSDGEPVIGNISFKTINGGLSILCTDEQLHVFDETTNTAKPILLPALTNAANPRLLRKVVSTGSHVYIRDRLQGVIEYDVASGTSKYLNIFSTTDQTTLTSLYVDSARNLLWVGVENDGIYIYDIGSKKVIHRLLNIPPSQKGASITAISEGAKGLVYASDLNYGVFVLNPAGEIIRRYTTQDNLLSNNCNHLCKDAFGNIWISSSDGISMFDTATKSFNNFPELKDAANYAAFITADDKGNVLLSAEEGFYLLNANKIINENKNGTIYLRSIKAEDQFLSVDTNFNFTYHQSNISLQFGLLNFETTGKPLLQYRLNNGDWLNLDNENSIAFSNLAPGKYLLTVREKNSITNELTIHFTISPPFYKTWWFLLSVCIVIAIGVILIFRYRLGIIKKQSALKQKIAETEMMALRAQMNPHFIFNCISSIDNFILGNEKEMASAYLNKFAKLIRNTLDSSKTEVVPFWKDWETMQLYLELESLRSNGKFSYQTYASDALLKGHYKIPALIIQPYLENAIHHGLMQRNDHNGKLTIVADLNNEVLTFTIQDNGVGRERSAQLKQINTLQHTSYGMQLSEDRITLFNNRMENNITITDLKDEDGMSKGTLVEVRLDI